MGRACRLLLALVVATLALPAIAQDKRVALSFDDVPRKAGAFFTPDERAEKLRAALREGGVAQAAFFVTPGLLDEPDGTGGEARIAAYVADGHVIANHSFAHRHLRHSTAEEYLADIDRAAAWFAGREGTRPWFRFPYLDEGGRDKAKRDAVRAGLAARGLRNGYVTADASDWHLEQLTLDAQAAGKAMDMKRLRRLYVASQMSGLEYHDALARLTLGRSPAHVLLLHETDLAALFLGDLIVEMRRRGWTVITADEAFADPISTAMPDVPYAYGTLIGSMAWEQGIDPPLSPMWMGTGTMTYLFQRSVLKDTAQ